MRCEHCFGLGLLVPKDRDERHGWTLYRCTYRHCGMATVIDDRGLVIPYMVWVTHAVTRSPGPEPRDDASGEMSSHLA